jgi:hypothetical protein
MDITATICEVLVKELSGWSDRVLCRMCDNRLFKQSPNVAREMPVLHSYQYIKCLIV